MEIRPSGSAASRRAPADYFTGAVWQDPIVEAPAPGNVRASVVRSEPGARTAWHTHPAGQTLYIVSGVGRVQQRRCGRNGSLLLGVFALIMVYA
jgi:quercetin dioxygenase-like cupin family protein